MRAATAAGAASALTSRVPRARRGRRHRAIRFAGARSPLRKLRSWIPSSFGIVTPSLCLVWLAFFCDYVLMTMVIPIFPLLNQPDILIGALFAAKAMCQIVFSPLMVRFVDSSGKSMIVMGLVLEALSVLAFAATVDYGIWFLARALSGVASAAIISAGLAHLSRCYSNVEQRAVAMGLATTGIIAGVCLGPVMGGVLYEASAALPFALLAALQVLTAVSALAYLPQLEPRESHEADKVAVGSMLRAPEVLRPLGALVVANAAISCLESTIGRHLTSTFHLSTGQVGAVFLLVSVPSCLLSGLAGPIGNRVGRTVLLRAGLLTQGLFTALGPKSSPLIMGGSLLGLGAGMGMVDGAAPPLLGEVADRRFGGSGKIFVLSNVAVQSGFMLGPLAGGALAQRYGFGACSFASGALLLLYSWLACRPRKNSQY